MTMGQLILQHTHYSSYYELYVMRMKLLNQLTTNTRSFKTVGHLPLPLDLGVNRIYDNYNQTWNKFVRPTVVRNTLLREELPRKTRLFFMLLTLINGNARETFRVHAQNRLMFMTADCATWTPFINVRKFFKKWLHTYDFLLNLFFARTCVLMYAPKAMKEEAISFNWSYGLIPFNLFKYAAPAFFMKNVPFGGHGPMAYRRLADTGIGVAFVADLKYHQGNLFHLKTTGFFVIGLVASTMNPWLVHYTIHAGSNTLFTQYFFVKFMAYMRQQAEYFIFANSRALWLK